MSKVPWPETLNFIFCNCKRSRCLKDCPCSKAYIAYVIECACTSEFGKWGRLVNEQTGEIAALTYYVLQ